MKVFENRKKMEKYEKIKNKAILTSEFGFFYWQFLATILVSKGLDGSQFPYQVYHIYL